MIPNVLRVLLIHKSCVASGPGCLTAWMRFQALFKYIRVVSKYTGNPETTINNAA